MNTDFVLDFIVEDFKKSEEDIYTCNLRGDDHKKLEGRCFSRPRKNELITTNSGIIFRIIDKITDSFPHKLILRKITDKDFECNTRQLSFEFCGKYNLDNNPNKFLSQVLKTSKIMTNQKKSKIAIELSKLAIKSKELNMHELSKQLEKLSINELNKLK